MEKDTKRCPYCGGEIKIAAKKCRHCGTWLNNQPILTAKNLTGKKMVLIASAIVAVILIIIAIVTSNQEKIYTLTSDGYNSYDYPTEVVDAEAEDYQDFGVGSPCPYDGIPDDDPDWFPQENPYSQSGDEIEGTANTWE